MRYIGALVMVGVLLAGCSSESALLFGAIQEAGPPTTITMMAPATPTTGTPETITTLITTTTTLPPLVVALAGDTSFTHGLAFQDPLGELDRILSAPDLTLVNLETTIAEPDIGQAYAKEYTFKSPPESPRLLIAAGIDGVALGNNHTLDFGPPALMRTLELLDEAGLARAGAGENRTEAFAPMMFEAAGRRVAVLSFSRILSQASWAADTDRPGIASAYAEWIPETVAAVQRVATDADLVAVMVHWGEELSDCPALYQRELATTWVEAGADLVVGSHPHVLQGVEHIGDAWIVYSTGNFAFPSARGRSTDSAIFEFTVDEGGTSLIVHPIHIVAGRPHPASDTQASEVLSLLSEHSLGVAFGQDGVAVASDSPGSCEWADESAAG